MSITTILIVIFIIIIINIIIIIVIIRDHQGSSQILSDVKFDSTIHKLWILIAEFIYIMLHPHSSSLLMVQYPILVL